MTSFKSPLRAAAALGLLAASQTSLSGCPHRKVDPPEVSSDGGAQFQVSGQAIRTAPALAPGEDGRGTLYIVGLSSCAFDRPPLAATGVPMADLAGDASVDFQLSEVPHGTLYLAAFLDDRADADPAMPAPGPGDLVLAEGLNDGVLTCVEVDVHTHVTDVQLALNQVRLE